MNCPVCNYELDGSFHYCPYCGTPVASNSEFMDIIEKTFEEIDGVVKKDALRRLDDLSSILDSIEKELESFIMSAK